MKKIIGVLCAFSMSVSFASLFPKQSDYYYALGGDSDIYIPPVSRTEHITIGGDVRLDGVLNCSNFNPAISIANSFNNLKEQVAGVPAGIVDNLKGSVGAYPMYKLHQSMPGLYDVLQNTSFSRQNEFQLTVSDCRQTKRHMEEGNSPLSSMLAISDSQGWIEAAKRAASNNKNDAVDIVESSKTIASKSKEYGIPWVHRGASHSGGVTQQPIEVISDVVIAGYNILLDQTRAIDSVDAASEAHKKSIPFARVWVSPKKAADFAVLVLGDIKVSHSIDLKNKEAKAGAGLSMLLQSCPKIASASTCVPNVAAFFWKIVDKAEVSSEENLRKLSAGNILITKDIITAISLMQREEQIMTVSKLSEEIAIQNLLDQALMLKRILQAGYQLQEVQNLKPAQQMVMAAIKKLDNDIQELAFEKNIREKMMTNTLRVIMSVRNNNLQKSQGEKGLNRGLIKNGAIYIPSKKEDK